MLGTGLIKKMFGSRNERIIKSTQKVVAQINQLEPAFEKLTNDELRDKTNEFRQRLKDGAKLNDLLPEAFATVRETSKRLLNMRHFDVQLIGGMVLNNSKIAEMGTGEGKTLAATLPIYLNALTGKGAHLVTVNDYLAKRDLEWMNPVYEFLGLSTGVIYSNMPHEEKKQAYAADVTYGTNNEFGFDYLRDNMAFSREEKVQRELHFAIVDEVDSILIDEARTPLIISGPSEESSNLYEQINKVLPDLKKQEEKDGPGDFSLDEKTKQAYLTEEGHEHVEKLFLQAGLIKEGESLYSPTNITLMHHLNAALRAHYLFSNEVDYIVQNNEIIIVDEHTGRTMPGRRWSDGLHQAVEAKEGVKIQQENQTLASITFQNYFRLYEKLAGMTGTADTEAFEFQQIYNLEVVVIPTNKPVIRKDMPDQIYLSAKEKFAAIITDIKNCLEKNQPVLVGTASIETSEYLSNLLNKEKIKHKVLNAKYHEQEAQIVADAGRPGTITIATNMAGRGTDIVLGGNVEKELAALGDVPTETKDKLKKDWYEHHESVLNAGGLHIIGSERHESRRIDNQLRGRSGRQGDPGSSRFYLSLDDNLMRIFASEKVSSFMQKLGLPEGEPIEHSWVTRAIENAQRKVEGHNFDIRKELLEYDNVANEQRKVIYQQRNELMSSDDISETINDIRHDVVDDLISQYIPRESFEEQWDVPGLEKQLEHDFNMQLPISTWLHEEENLHEETLRERIAEAVTQTYNGKEKQTGSEVMRQFEKAVMLQCLDSHWKEHLAAMDHLRQGIHLRGYAQKNPKQEYKKESFELFQMLLDNIKRETISILISAELQQPDDVQAVEMQRRNNIPESVQFQHAQTPFMPQENEYAQQPLYDSEKAETFTREAPKVGRNDPCPCGSDKKYKQCHGKLA